MQKINNLLHRNRDANGNGIPDSQERDRNHNGIPDSQERRGPVEKVKDLLHLNRDANHNGIPDSQERRGYGYTSTLADRNHNGIPDSQERGFSRMPTVPAPFLERRSALHRELLGRNGQWNLRGAQTRSFMPRDYYNMETRFNTENETLIRTLAPVNVERIEKEVVVHEHLHPVEKEEIQPVIYREREQLDIKQITQQLHETQIQPTLIQQRELTPQVREAVVERSAPIQENIVLPSTDIDATMRSVQVNQPIVNETVKKTVIEEVQPVLERDVIAPTLVRETQPIYEKVVEAPHVYRETLPVRELGSRSLGTGEIFASERSFAPSVAPVAQLPLQAQQLLVQPVSVQTTTTTTDSFVPAKLVKEGELRRNTATGAPLSSRVL